MHSDSARQRVLVTGGAGFLGSHLCELLLSEGCEVLCVDDFSTGARHNVEHLLGHPRFRLMTHDVTVPLDAHVNRIYNLACPASPVHYQRDPVQTTKTCVLGALNMLALARRKAHASCRHRPARSTAILRCIRNTRATGATLIRSAYAAVMTKASVVPSRCSSTITASMTWTSASREFSIPMVRRMDPQDGRVVSNFIVQALRGEPLMVYGDGLQTRSFCFVDDMVTGLHQFMEADSGGTGPVNIGNPHEFTVRDLAGLIIELTGSSSKLAFSALPSDDPTQRRPDVSNAERMFCWKPRVSLVQGLERTIVHLARLTASAGSGPSFPNVHGTRGPKET